MQAYAPLATVRGAFAAGVSRACAVMTGRGAGCGRGRKAVVAEPRWAFVGLTPSAGSERAPRRPLIPDGALIPVGVDVRQDGAPERIEFPGAGAPCAPQFRFGPLDGAGGSEAGAEFGDRRSRGRASAGALPLVREEVAIDLGHGGPASAFSAAIFIEHRNGMSTVVTEDEAGVRKGAPRRRAQASGVEEAVVKKPVRR